MRRIVRSGLAALVVVLAGCSATVGNPGASGSDWSYDVWTDSRGQFDISVAKGYAQDPAAGKEGDPTSVVHFVNADASASLSVAALQTQQHGDLQYYVDRYREQIAQHSEYDLLGDTPTVLADGRSAHRFDATGQGKRIVWFIVDDPKTFDLIAAVAVPDRWDAEQLPLLEMARSFTLHV
jgi:hypothetical protein